MTGWTWVLGRSRARKWGSLGLLLSIAGGLAACSAGGNEPSVGAGGDGFGAAGSTTPEPPPPDVAGSTAVGTGGSVGTSVGFAGSTGADFGNGNGVTCTTPASNTPVFLGQVLTPQTAGRGELYAWVNDEQAAALRTDQVLLPAVTPENDALIALQALSTTMATASQILTAKVATALQPLLSHARIAWPEPWALRIGPGGEDNGGNLVRVVLKPEAWVAVVKGGSLQVLDLDNQTVSLSDAATTPERIGAIFNERDGFENGPSCNGSAGGPGLGFRQFLLTNLAMVQEWSLGTQEIRDRLQANLDLLSQFLVRIRPCPDQSDQQFWNQQVVCSWDAQITLPVSEQVAYRDALATPIGDYLGAPAQLGALIAKLQGDLFTPDPMVVTTGSP